MASRAILRVILRARLAMIRNCPHMRVMNKQKQPFLRPQRHRHRHRLSSLGGQHREQHRRHRSLPASNKSPQSARPGYLKDKIPIASPLSPQSLPARGRELGGLGSGAVAPVGTKRRRNGTNCRHMPLERPTECESGSLHKSETRQSSEPKAVGDKERGGGGGGGGGVRVFFF